MTMDSIRLTYILFLCLSTQQAISAYTANPNSKTYSDLLRDFVKEANSNVNKSNLLSTSKKTFDLSSVIKFYQHIEASLFEDLDTNNDSESMFSSPNGPFSKLFRKYGFSQIVNINSSKCVNDTGRVIIGFLNKESWAVQFFDATGKPGPSLTQGWLNFVGNYDQCNSATIPLKVSPTGKNVHGRYFQVFLKPSALPIFIQIGLCLPDSCSEKEINSLGTEIGLAANGSFSIAAVHHLTNSTEVTSATFVASIVSCLICFMMVLGTLFDVIFIQYPLPAHNKSIHRYVVSTHNGYATTVLDNGNHANNERTSSPKPEPLQTTSSHKSIATNILLSFSIYSNAKKILNVSQSPGSIESIHGIRFLSISWVVLGHTYFFARGYAVNTVVEFPDLIHRWTFDAIMNSLVSVDTFFTLSGLLTSYLTINQLLTKGLKINWPMFYFHRFWRLTPPYMLSILLYLGFQQYFIKGALRNYEQPTDKSFCEKNWWTNLLYINNLVKLDEMCFGHSWYLANDMQFFIVSPFLTIPFYFHRIAGICSCFVFLIASWITIGVSSTLEEWPATGLGLKSLENMMQGGLGNLDYNNHYYNKPWCRIGPFIVGVLAGYVLAVNKGRPFYMKWWIVLLGWFVATGSALAVLYGIRGDITGDDPSSIGAAALYNAVSRSVWGACVCWVIIACTAGYGGPVNALLSWSPFVVLGRLSYMVYLLHIPILLIFYQNLDQLFYLNDTTMAVYYMGFLVASNVVAFVFMLGLESPMIGLEKAILKR